MIKISEGKLPIEIGEKGENAAKIQEAIMRIHEAYGGIIPDEQIQNFVDGNWGPKTQAAFETAQRMVQGIGVASANVNESGVYDAATHLAFSETVTMLHAFEATKEVMFSEVNVQSNEQDSPSALTHKVVSGDTLGKIAENFEGVSWRDIYAANPHIGDNPDNIQIGIDLVIPGFENPAPSVGVQAKRAVTDIVIAQASTAEPVITENGVTTYATTSHNADLMEIAAPSFDIASKKPVFTLDVGHGNVLGSDRDGDGKRDVLKDRGAPTADSSLAHHEREVLLELAPYITAALEKAGFDVMVVGDHGDHEVAPNKYDFRINAAHENDAVMHATLHADGHDNANVNGARYYSHEYAGENSTAALWAANLTEADEYARGEAKTTRTSLIQPTAFHSPNGEHRSVSEGLKVPGVLVEAGFVSNKEDLKRLTSESGRQEFADAFVKGTVATYEEMREKDASLPPLEPEGVQENPLLISRNSGGIQIS